MRKHALAPSSLVRLVAIMAFAICLSVAPSARAGVIIPATAAGTLALTDFATSVTTPLTFPSTNPFSFTSGVIGGGGISGSYAFTDGSQDTLAVNVQESSGRTGARTTLTLTFMTAQDAMYTIIASAVGVTGFVGKLDAVVADQSNAFGSPPSGNIPPLTPLTLTGFLPAGAHTYSIDYTQAPIPNAPFETSGLASFTVTLAPAGGTAVPLPPGVWPGLALAGGLIVSRAKRGGRTTTCRRQRTRGGGIGIALAMAAVLTVAGPARAAFISGLVNVDFNSTSTPTYGGAAVLGSSGDV